MSTLNNIKNQYAHWLDVCSQCETGRCDECYAQKELDRIERVIPDILDNPYL